MSCWFPFKPGCKQGFPPLSIPLIGAAREVRIRSADASRASKWQGAPTFGGPEVWAWFRLRKRWLQCEAQGGAASHRLHYLLSRAGNGGEKDLIVSQLTGFLSFKDRPSRREMQRPKYKSVWGSMPASADLLLAGGYQDLCPSRREMQRPKYKSVWGSMPASADLLLAGGYQDLFASRT